MKPKTKFNGWMLGKIRRFLEVREGCLSHSGGYTKDGARLTIQDSLGFIYEINIKTVGRSQHAGSLQNVLPFRLERVK